MSTTGVFTAEYTIPIGGQHYTERVVEWRDPKGGLYLSVRQEDNDAMLRLTIVLSNTTEAEGAQKTEDLAHWSLETVVVDHAALTIHAGPLGAARVAASAVIATRVDPSAVELMLAATANYCKSPAAQTIRRMFRLALESPLPTERYLMIYSALMLLAEVAGRTADPKQGDVDAMLLREDSSIPKHPNPRNPTKFETVFTKVRNEFVHAETRGRDAKTAAQEMGSHVDRFKNLAARIIAAEP